LHPDVAALAVSEMRWSTASPAERRAEKHQVGRLGRAFQQTLASGILINKAWSVGQPISTGGLFDDQARIAW